MSSSLGQSSSLPMPHDLGVHNKIKEIGDSLRPDLVRMCGTPTEKSGNPQFYRLLLVQLFEIKKQVSNHDTICFLQNAISHLKKAIELSESSAINEEILWQLQEVMALLFKLQNLPC